MNEIVILGIYVKERSKNATAVQQILTQFGCSIKTRLGLHEVEENTCSTNGLILIELTGAQKEMKNLETELRKLNDIEIQKMTFNNK